MSQKEIGLQWFHVFRNMVTSGQIKRLPPSSVVVYLVIKSACKYVDGVADIDVDEIQQLSGQARNTVFRALRELAKEGLIEKKPRPGKSSIYHIREVFGTNNGNAMIGYVPANMKQAISELDGIIKTGRTPEGGLQFVQYVAQRSIHIENLHIHTEAGNIKGTPFARRLGAVCRGQIPVEDFLAEFYDGELHRVPQEILDLIKPGDGT